MNETAGAYLFVGILPLVLALLALLPDGRSPHGSPHPLKPTATDLAGVALAIAAIASVTVAAFVTWIAPIRLRMGGVVVFSARSGWRPWIVAALVLAVQFALRRWVPDTGTRGWWTRLVEWRKTRSESAPLFYAALTILAVLLSIGPPLGIWPLVYWMPGLNFIRVPSRFMILAVLGVAILAGMGLERLRRGRPARAAAALAIVAVTAVIAELSVAPLNGIPFRVEIPAADAWLAQQPGTFTIAEFPAAGIRGGLPAARQQSVYMLHSMAHWQKTIHGHSGIEPAGHTSLYARLLDFPSDDSLAALSGAGVEYVVVHPSLYPPGEWPAVAERLTQFPERLILRHEEGLDRVYSLK